MGKMRLDPVDGRCLEGPSYPHPFGFLIAKQGGAMERKLWLFLSMVLFGLSLAAIAGAQTTYDDPQGRFAIDVPKGWQLAPQTDDKVFVFQGEGKSIIIECVPGMNDPAELFKKAETTVRLSGMAKPALEGEITVMTVNGLSARWGVFKGTMSGVTLAALCGVVANGENGLYFLSFIAVTDMTAWKGKLEKAFQTIRAKGGKVTGVEGVKAVAAAAAPAAEPTPWKGALVSLTLPPGWTETPKPRGIEKEVQGMFANASLPGVTLMAVGYKGAGMSMAKALDAGIKTFKIPVPNAQPVDVQEMEIEGKKVNVVVYKGTSVGAGTEVEIGAVIAVMKAEKCYTNLIAIGQATVLAEMKAQVLEIAKTVK
jgi:hypothetical protein